MTPINSPNSRIVLITGASSGIGARTAEYLATKGFTVILVARREEKLVSIVNNINSKSGIAYFFSVDLSKQNARIALYNTLLERKLLPEILINNAGFGWYGHFETMNWQTARDLIAVNVEAVAHLTHLLLPSMIAQKRGHIINIGSIAGKLPEQGIALYSASKAFLDAFTTSIYRELRGTKVNVSIARLGPIQTEFFDAARKHENGGNVPAEKMATSVYEVARGLYNLINQPRKVVYIPWFLYFSPLLETLFSSLIDLFGPILLGKKSQKP